MAEPPDHQLNPDDGSDVTVESELLEASTSDDPVGQAVEDAGAAVDDHSLGDLPSDDEAPIDDEPAGEPTGAEPPPSPPAGDSGLNPRQQHAMEILGAAPGERPTFDPGLAAFLRAELEHHLLPVVEKLPADADTLWINKHSLSSIHGCEVRYLADKAEPFAWTVANARGIIAHKAIELLLAWRGEVVPLDLVDEAMARIESGDKGLADFLQTAEEADLAELRAAANERVTAYLEVFPPLKRRWRPVTEARLRTELCDDRVVLSGKVDLALGVATGSTAGKVLVDFKTGGPALHHRDDLRFYALLEALRLGVPPRRLATFYLDSGRIDAEDITEELLDATVRRVTDGITRLAALERAPDDAVLRPGKACRWCSRVDDCDTGQEWLEQSSDALY